MKRYVAKIAYNNLNIEDKNGNNKFKLWIKKR